jgi:hypothetical protein
MVRKQFLLRIDPELWKELEKWAADDLRSVNAQIEWLLREAVRKRGGGRARQDQASCTCEEEYEDDHAADPQLPQSTTSISAEPATAVSSSASGL